MLFSSYAYILLFLPSVFALAGFLGARGRGELLRACLAIASLVFYAWMDAGKLPVLLVSIIVNFLIAKRIEAERDAKNYLAIGVSFNVIFLGVFKYAGWTISGINEVFSTSLAPPAILFPVGISFYTFGQISYLVDLYRKEAAKRGFLDYVLFVSFFPKLMQGPIARYKEVAPQFYAPENLGINLENVSRGLFLFSLGLFKKVIIADTLAGPVATAFDSAPVLDFFESWLALLCYTFQIYFDFSGYTDMALGSALVFNIRLPINFFSPYSARSIQDFWRRWHITLGHFLRDYIYIPLGGSRRGTLKTYRNLVLTFLVAGIWHGAGLNFALWGLLHGVGLAVHRMWQKTGIKLPGLVAWALTFGYICFTWIFFRAQSWQDAQKVLKGCLGLSGFALPPRLAEKLPFLRELPINFDVFMINMGFADRELPEMLICLLLAAMLAFIGKNSSQIAASFKGSLSSSVLAAALAAFSILNLHKLTSFVYFDF